MSKLFMWLADKFKKTFGEILVSLGLAGARRAAKMAFRFAAILAIPAAFILLQNLCVSLLQSIIYIPSDPMLQTAVYVLLPDNASTCISVMISVLVAKAAFAWVVWQKKQIMTEMDGIL